MAVTVDTGSHTRTMLEASRASDKGEPVKEIGEDAYLALPGSELGVVAFVNGEVSVIILVRTPNRDRAALLTVEEPPPNAPEKRDRPAPANKFTDDEVDLNSTERRLSCEDEAWRWLRWRVADSRTGATRLLAAEHLVSRE